MGDSPKWVKSRRRRKKRERKREREREKERKREKETERRQREREREKETERKRTRWINRERDLLLLNAHTFFVNQSWGIEDELWPKLEYDVDRPLFGFCLNPRPWNSMT